MAVRFLLLPAIAVLAACAPDPATPDDGQDAGQDTDAPASVPAAQPGSDPGAQAALTAIPARFQGVWDYVEGTCAAESDLRTEIEGKRILFYESVGEVTAVERFGDDAIDVTLSMAGEGESWTMERRFTLEKDDARLVPAATDPSEQFTPMPLKRCEG